MPPLYTSPYRSPYAAGTARIPEIATTSTGLGNLLDLLDMPGGYARGALAGRFGERLSGKEFNQAYGMGDSALAGLATEILLDPLNLIGAGALTKAGKIVSKAGRLGRAGEYLTNAAKAGAASAPIAQRAEQAAAKAGRSLGSYSAAEIAGKPLVRPRAASRFGTARQIAAGMDNASGEADELLKLAKGVEDMPLSKDVGIGLPFMNPLVSFNIPGGEKARDLIDAAVVGAKFSAPLRYGRKLFDSSVGGQFDEAAQVFSSGAKTLADDAVARKTAEGTKSMMELMQGRPDAMTREGGIAISDDIEQGRKVGGEFIEDPAVEKYIDWWEDQREDFLDRSREAGIGSGWTQNYLPRTYSPIAEDAFARASKNRASATSVASGDQLKRADYMNSVWRSEILEMSTDPDLVGPSRLPQKEAAEKIYKRYFEEYRVTDFSNKPPYERVPDPDMVKRGRKHSEELAHFLSKIDTDKLPQGLFSEHPTRSILSYMQRRERAITNANSIGEYIATKATKTAGERSITVKDALQRGGLRVANKGENLAAVREIIARREGVSPDAISLSDYFVPESIGSVVSSSLSAPETKKNPSGLGNIVKYIGDLWRNSILAFPSRYARDLVGGSYVNWLEGAASYFGYRAAGKVLNGRAVDSVDFLRQIPRYAGTADDAALTVQFYSDLAATGLADGMLRYDMGASDAIQTTLPGIDAIGTSFRKLGGSAVGQKGGVPNLLNPRSAFYEETSAVNNFVDIYNRLAGYMELLRQGVDPAEAGRRMKRAHVDYSGLTATEQAIKQYMPFYTYTSRIAQETGRKLVEQPRRLVASMRAVESSPETVPEALEMLGFPEQEGGYIPKNLRERVAFPIGQNAQGRTVASGVDLPGIDAINTLAGPDRVYRTISQVGPLPKMAVEYLSGRDMFTGRPMSERKTPLGEIVGGDNVITREADRFLEAAPLYPRFIRVARDIAGTRSTQPLGTRLGTTALNLLTGLNARTMDNDYLQSQAMYELEDATDPYSKTYETRYIPEEDLATMPPEVQRSWEALQQLRAVRRKARANARL